MAAGLVSGGDLCVLQMATFSLCSRGAFLGAYVRKESPPLFIRPPILSDEDPPLIIPFRLQYFIKAPPPNSATLQVKASTYEFRGWDHNSVIHSIPFK